MKQPKGIILSRSF